MCVFLESGYCSGLEMIKSDIFWNTDFNYHLQVWTPYMKGLIGVCQLVLELVIVWTSIVAAGTLTHVLDSWLYLRSLNPLHFMVQCMWDFFFFSWAHASFHTLYTRPPVLNKLPAWLLVEQEKSFSSKDSLYELAACILNFESVQFIAFHSNFLECSIIIIFNWCIWISR